MNKLPMMILKIRKKVMYFSVMMIMMMKIRITLRKK